MAWWVWLLLGWLVLATVAAFWLGAAAAVVRRREHVPGSSEDDEPAGDARAGDRRAEDLPPDELRIRWDIAG